MPINGIPLLIPGCGYKIDCSARFRGNAATAHLARTPAIAGNRRKFSFLTWLKRTTINGVGAQLFGAGPDASNATILYLNDGAAVGSPQQSALNLYHVVGGVAQWAAYGADKLLDQMGWYPVAVGVDLDAASNKIRMWVGLTELSVITLSGTVTAADTFINSTNPHWISRRHDAPSQCNDQMLAETIFLDGVQISSPLDFGALAPVWVPKKPVVPAYGINGFFLEFKDPAQMGKDTSGQGNHWTATGVLSTDQMTDTPTNGGNVFDPMYPLANKLALSSAGRAATSSSGAANYRAFTSLKVGAGKWYCEAAGSGFSNYSWTFGITPANQAEAASGGLIGYPASEYAIWFQSTGNVYSYQNGASILLGSTAAAAHTPGIALDLDSRKLWVRVDGGAWLGGGDPVAGTAPTFSGIAAVDFCFAVATGQTGTVTLKSAANEWTAPAPSGFKAVCTANMPPSTPATSGSFTGNLSADGPRIVCGGSPATLTINGNPVTWGVDAIKLSDGFKVISTSASYNTSGTNTWVATIGAKLVTGECRVPNPAQIN